MPALGINGSNDPNQPQCFDKVKKLPSSLWQKMWDTAKEDPRRVIHAVKVGSALTLVSLLYLLGPLVNIFGSNAMWAIITVTLVLEFTVGEFSQRNQNPLTI